MKVYLINLARRVERLAYMKSQFVAANIPFERIDAVDGKMITRDDRPKLVNEFRWWCVHGYIARSGEVGCALSHQKVYRKMIDENIGVACILEDDIKIDARFCDMIRAVENFMSVRTPARVLIMTPYKGRGVRDASKPLFTRVDWASSTGGYVLNVEAARRLLEVNTPLVGTADNWGRWARRANIELYNVDPIVCWQDEYASVPDNPAFVSDTIDSETVFVKDMPIIRRILHKIGRVVGFVIDKVLP